MTEFHIKLLCLFLLHSITTTFCTTIQNRVGTLLRNDGQQYILWLICNHFYACKNAFNKTIRDSIRSRSLAKDHTNNIESYVDWV